jgi:beta-lactamase regulating signal transducer with metallopeptidase domain
VADMFSWIGIWLITFTLHSTLFLTCASFVERLRLVNSPSARESLWRIAMIGGLLTTTAQGVSGVYQVGSLPRWTLGHVILESSSKVPLAMPLRNGDNPTPALEISTKKIPTNSTNSLSDATFGYAFAELFAYRFTILLALVWAVGACTNTARLVFLGLRARAELRSRELVEPNFLKEIQLIAEAAKVCVPRLTVATHIAGPVSLPNGEIVAPHWVFLEIPAVQRHSIYAHEIAHHVRRDPIWLLMLHFLNTILWIQPLHGLARRRLVHLAELQADSWAARYLGNTRDLATSLLACAERVTTVPQFSFGSSFSLKGAFEDRIDCLLDGRAMEKPRSKGLVRFAAIVGLAFALFLVPGCDVDSEMAYRNRESVSVTKQDNGRKVEVLIRRANLFVKLTHDGTLKLNAENEDVESLDAGGRFVFSESQGPIKRVYTVEANAQGDLTRSYSLNGKSTPIDEDVRSWLANSLGRTIRETDF